MPTPDRPRRVLIADDNPAMRQSLREILSYEGYEAVEAVDGGDALELLTKGLIDILLLDLAMPKLSGIELLQQLEVPPPVVIIHSAFIQYTTEEMEQQVGHKWGCPDPTDRLIMPLEQRVASG